MRWQPIEKPPGNIGRVSNSHYILLTPHYFPNHLDKIDPIKHWLVVKSQVSVGLFPKKSHSFYNYDVRLLLEIITKQPLHLSLIE